MVRRQWQMFWGENWSKVTETLTWGHRDSPWQWLDAELNSHCRRSFIIMAKLVYWRDEGRKDAHIKSEKHLKKEPSWSLILNISKIWIYILKQSPSDQPDHGQHFTLDEVTGQLAKQSFLPFVLCVSAK